MFMTARRVALGRGAGFTLVEMLVVIGIVIALVGILLPVIFSVRRQADRARTADDIVTISHALEAYNQDWGDYPRWQTNPQSGSYFGSGLLGFALLHSNGNATPAFGFRARPSSGAGQYYTYLPTDRFQMSGTEQIYDRNGLPFLYAVARKPAPDLTVANTATPANQPYLVTSPVALYTFWSGGGSGTSDVGQFGISGDTGTPPAPAVAPSWAALRMQMLLGDLNGNGIIDNGETPAAAGPYILWAAGPDKYFGFPNDNPSTAPALWELAKCDDVTNFTFAK